MSTYDISGLDWQTAHNNSTAAPSCRESDGMTKVADSFYEGQMEDPENLPTGHRGFKEEVMASMRAELESAEAYEPCGVDFLDSLFRESDSKRAEAMRKALEFMETR